MAYFGTIVKSVQRGTFTIADTQTSGTATLGTTLTDLAKSELRVLGHRPGDTTFADPRKIFPTVVLTNTTTVTATLNGAANGTMTISYEVTEFV